MSQIIFYNSFKLLKNEKPYRFLLILFWRGKEINCKRAKNAFSRKSVANFRYCKNRSSSSCLFYFFVGVRGIRVRFGVSLGSNIINLLGVEARLKVIFSKFSSFHPSSSNYTITLYEYSLVKDIEIFFCLFKKRNCKNCFLFIRMNKLVCIPTVRPMASPT